MNHAESPRVARQRLAAIVHGSAVLISCWLLLQAAHEAGHILAVKALGGTVEHVVLHPLAWSRTDRSGSRSPVIDTWAGPACGCLLPALALLALVRTPLGGYARLFLGLCLVANGVYLCAGWSEPACDAGELRALGVPVPILIISGAALVALGLWALSPMGLVLGYRGGSGVGWRRSIVAAALAVVLIAIGFAADLR